jgi:hypothetical protein
MNSTLFAYLGSTGYQSCTAAGESPQDIKAKVFKSEE